MRFADFSFFSIWFSVFVKNTCGFSVLVPDVVFGFSHFVLFWVPVSVRFEQHFGGRIAAERQSYLEECVTK